MKSNYFTSNAGVRQGENLSPLLFSLYINDLEEYLLAKGNNFIDFKDEICNNYMKLLVLLYADDTIVLSNTAAGLQKALDDLSNYCTEWKLQVNSGKTKVIIFSKRKPKNLPVFTYNNEALENVSEFKYLGVYFKSNGNFNKHKMHIKETASKAMFALLSRGRVLQLPVDIMLEMFNKTVLPIMLYGCEVWGVGKNDMLDTVFLKFCKFLLGLKSCTPSCMVYGELGCYPVSLTIQIRIISYWLKLASSKENKICRKLYELLFNMHLEGRFQSEWLNCVRTILERNGYGDIWFHQGFNCDVKATRDALKDRLQDQFRQEWSSTMEASTKCVLYRNLKIKFELEAYLLRLPRNIWRNIVKLRCCNHKLEIETGRYAGIDRDLRYCGKCAMNVIGDEYHVFFECSNANISLQRNRFIPTYFRQNRSMFNFVKLLQSVDDIKVGRRVSSFVTNSNIV